MGRLIDADTLLKKFDDTGIHITFDLPVEEILGEGVDIDDFSMLVQDTIQAYKKMVIETIKEQPTAYDVEAVVAELEKEKEVHTEHFRISLYKDYPEIKQMYEKVCLVIDKVISIVRGKE